MKYPIGIQSFEKLREEGYVYVDKTDLIYSLTHEGCVYFLGRPRRFGKSLLISTLKSYYLGKKELFKGLAIEELEKDWKTYPVFHLDFGIGTYANANALDQVLDTYLSEWEEKYKVVRKPNITDFSLRFKKIIEEAHRQSGLRAVVLIDEYDKHLQFVLLTGVTKFSQVSVFSDFNQPSDISMSPKYEALCGITVDEMLKYFAEPIDEMAKHYRCSKDGMIAMLKKQYDGYLFSDLMQGVFNPYSLLNTFQKLDIRDYCF